MMAVLLTERCMESGIFRLLSGSLMVKEERINTVGETVKILSQLGKQPEREDDRPD